MRFGKLNYLSNPSITFGGKHTIACHILSYQLTNGLLIGFHYLPAPAASCSVCPRFQPVACSATHSLIARLTGKHHYAVAVSISVTTAANLVVFAFEGLRLALVALEPTGAIKRSRRA